MFTVSAAAARDKGSLATLGFARQVADTVCVLDGGGIIESGSAEPVLTDPRHERTRQFLRRVTGARD